MKDLSVTVGGTAKVIAADVMASNGVVHVIDTVLIPPKNIVELAVGTPDLSTLVTALTAGQLTGALAGAGPFTVFAPSNAAFAKLPTATLNHLLDPANLAELQAVLKYHVVSGAAVKSSDLQATQDVTTLEGQDVTIEMKDLSVTVGGTA